MKNKIAFIIYSVILFILCLTPHNSVADSKSIDFTSSNLPIIIIETHGQSIPYDKPRIVADMGIIYNGHGQRNYVIDPYNNYQGKIAIEIRGSSSAGWSKKSYRIETQNEDGSNRNVSLLGFPKENDWILYAPYYDRSFLRNVLVYKLSNEIGRYASRTKYCELVLNGNYQGIYVLMEKIKRDKNRVDIAKLNPDEITGDDLTGGYIIKIDKEPWKPGFDSKHKPFSWAWQKIRYQYVYPKPEDIVSEQESYIQGFINDFEDVMAGENYDNPVDGYASDIDVGSFVDYFIINELSKNVDAYRLSTYFHKDKDSKGGKLTAGPVWDFNFSFGNVGYYDSELIAGWELTFLTENLAFQNDDTFQVPFWWKRLITDANFSKRIRDRWNELRLDILHKDSIFQFIDRVADTLDEAQSRNFQIWIGPGDPKLPEDGWFPPTNPIDHLETYADEIDYLKTWFKNRSEWIDQNVSVLMSASEQKNTPLPASFELKQNYPNPFNSVTRIAFELFLPTRLELSVVDLVGNCVRILANDSFSAGQHSILFDANEFSTGVYFCVLKTDQGFQKTRKMVLIK